MYHHSASRFRQPRRGVILQALAAARGDGTLPGWFDEAYLPNFTYFPGDVVPINPITGLPTPTGTLRDPERAPRYPDGTAGSLSQKPYTGGFNVPYTYP